ncbi:response regulator [Granulicella sp. 5B5]|nr:response regulator [Granulicella sp. 5B5]
METVQHGDRLVLVVDDEPAMRTALEASFLRHGWRVATANGLMQAKAALSHAAFDLVVSDVRMRDGDGLDVLSAVRSSSPASAVILLTAYANVPEAVESMRGGAVDYLTKPIPFDALLETAERMLRRTVHANDFGRTEKSTPKTMTASRSIVGTSPLLLRALERASAAAGTDVDVLVEAESGTGKELLARFIHDSSPRRGKPFVAINCAAVPEHLIESELFGHSKGAFTGASALKIGKFELADGGTLLLDEIGEMPLHLQPKLLRVLQEREFERLGETRSVRVNIRVIATTNARLSKLVDEGKFRGDLYYRLNVIPLSVPPLRERTEDIELLAHHFAERFALERSCEMPELRKSFLERLRTHPWPGNIRELSNFMQRVLCLYAGQKIDAACFDCEFGPVKTAVREVQPVAMSLHAGTRLSVIERQHLEKTLALANGNRTHAAEMLGISLRTVRNKIKEYGLPPRSLA